MSGLIDAALDRNRVTLLALALLFLGGIVAYVTIPKESDPDVKIPLIIVTLQHDGISPEDGERLLIRPVEKLVRTVEGVKETRSTAYESRAQILLEFEAGFDVAKALSDVRRKVDEAKRDLPSDTKDPTVKEVNVGLFPVLVVTLSGEVPNRTLLALARRLKEKLEALPSVLEAEIAGNRTELLEVVVDPLRLESYAISQEQLIRAVTLNNRLVPAGSLDTGHGRFAVKVPGLFETAKDVFSLPVAVKGDAVVTLADVASIRRTYKDAESYARLDGRPAIALEIKKRLGQNVIDTNRAVRELVAAESRHWPTGVKVAFSQDKSTDIRIMLTDLQNAVLAAVLLVMVVVLGTLGLRSGLLVGIAVPASFLIGILTLSVMGLTVNIVVLFSLILAVGMLVDGAIVVVEFADRRMGQGVPRAEAYREAAKRMAIPVLAATAVTVAVFLPLMFWPGVVGQFMKFLPITLVATLAASFLVAMVFTPVLGAIFGKPARQDAEEARQLAAAEHGDLADLRGFSGFYVKLSRVAIRHPLIVIGLAIAALVGSQMAYGRFGHGVEFFPDVEPKQALVTIHARGNLSIDEKDALVREVEARVLTVGGFDSVYSRTGQSTKPDIAEDAIGVVTLELADWQTRPKARALLDEIRARTRDISGIRVETSFPRAGPPVGKPVQLQLSSRDPSLLPAAVAAVRAKFESIAGLIDVEDSRALPGIEWQLQVDRTQAGRFGANVTDVGNLVQMVTVGIKVGAYRPDDADEEVDIRVRFPADERGLGQFDTLKVQTRDGLVPISNFVLREPMPKVGTIGRIDGKRTMSVKADLAPGVLADAKVRELRAWLETRPLDPRIETAFRGQDKEQRAAGQFLVKAFVAALFLIAVILVLEFNSFWQAFILMTAVVMSTIGVMLGLLVTGQPFGIVMSGIGVIALAGVVVNHNIVLIDTYNHLRREGMAAEEAILRTGAQRLRPVVLTSITTALGLLPLMFGINLDFVAREVTIGAPSIQWWVQLATGMVVGVSFATVLTLIVTPSLLMLGAMVSERMARLRGRAVTA
ncbi:MAG: efflux RND transporter permease subunit [Alphaproteobacteria bacterium]|nr:efflux RND transporter permease subunit [Alphaproteobacteria bacterium]